MKILITGADGYIGALLAPFLLDRGHHVVGLDTGFYRDGWLYNNGVQKMPACINKDIRQITTQDLQEFEVVVHLAELSNDPLGQHNPEITYQINHHGTVALARKCKSVGITRFVYTSSCSVYGVGAGEYKTEESAPHPQTAYAKCKVLVEHDLLELADADFSPTFLRNATAYGPSPRMRFDLVLNNLAGLAWTAKEIRLTSDGTPWRPLVHVLDICEAIACTIEAPREVVHNQILNVGDTKENYQIKEVAEIISYTFPGCMMLIGKSDGDNRSYRVSFEKINALLPGFRCQRSATIGAHQLLKLFTKIDMTREVFGFRAYTRLKNLEYLLKTRQIDSNLFWQ